MNEITEKIQKAIDESLPTQVGQALKTRLQEADKDKARVKQMEESYKVLLEEHSVACVERDKLILLQIKEDQLKAKEQELKLKEGLLKLKEEHAIERVQDVKEVVAQVFANNRYKYHSSGTVPFQDGNGYVQSGCSDKTIETEG